MRFFRPLRRIVSALSLMAGVALLGATGSASAQALFLPADNGAVPADAQPAAPQALRSRLVRIDANSLSRHVVPAGADTAANRATQASQLDGVIRLNLFDDVMPTFRRTKVTAQRDGGYIWEGIVPGQPVHEALLVIRDGRISGRVQLQDRLFRIDSVGGNTLHRVTELNPAAFKPEAPPKVAPHSDAAPAAPERNDIAPHATSTIRVFVAYTAAAKNQAGSTANILDEIDQAIALANQAYDNGNIPITLVLAGTMQATYTEKADIEDDLNQLTTGNALKPVRTKRASTNADLAMLFRKNDPDFCGIAWLPGNGIMPKPSAGTADTGYSVVVHSCVSNLSFHHELGHNMGLQHDRYVYRLQTGDPNPPASYYNFGYSNKGKRMRTIMAYNNDCADDGFNCTRINWFSSGTIRATGNVVIGKPKGTSNAADNTTRLKQTRTAISNYE
jgi:hypothetical protein